MAKSGVKKWIPGGIALVLGLVAFLLMFANAVGAEGEGYTGAELAFGKKVLGQEMFSFNILIFLGFALPLIGGILALITGNGFLMKIITTACFVVGAVFLFCTASFSSIGIAEGAKEMWEAMVKEGLIKLQAGPIIAGILAILGAVVCFFKGTIANKIGD